MGEFLRVSTPCEGVALVEMARAPVNAFHEPMWTEFGKTFDEISKNGDIRVVILASAQKLFTAGLDLVSAMPDLDHPDASRRALYLANHIREFQACISALERCRQPVIAAVHGVAYGLAIDIICACDIRYAATSADFSIKEVDVGMAADIGTLARLPKIVGNHSLMRELVYTGRRFNSDEAEKLGLVNKVVQGGRAEVIAAALETAKVIATKSPIAIIGSKQILNHARDHSVDDNLEYTAVWNSAMLQSEDFVQSFMAFKTKKAPKFKGFGKL